MRWVNLSALFLFSCGFSAQATDEDDDLAGKLAYEKAKREREEALGITTTTTTYEAYYDCGPHAAASEEECEAAKKKQQEKEANAKMQIIIAISLLSSCVVLAFLYLKIKRARARPAERRESKLSDMHRKRIDESDADEMKARLERIQKSPDPSAKTIPTSGQWKVTKTWTDVPAKWETASTVQKWQTVKPVPDDKSESRIVQASAVYKLQFFPDGTVWGTCMDFKSCKAHSLDNWETNHNLHDFAIVGLYNLETKQILLQEQCFLDYHSYTGREEMIKRTVQGFRCPCFDYDTKWQGAVCAELGTAVKEEQQMHGEFATELSLRDDFGGRAGARRRQIRVCAGGQITLNLQSSEEYPDLVAWKKLWEENEMAKKKFDEMYYSDLWDEGKLGTAARPQATNPPLSGQWNVVKKCEIGLHKGSVSAVYKLHFFDDGMVMGIDPNNPKVTMEGVYNVETKQVHWRWADDKGKRFVRNGPEKEWLGMGEGMVSVKLAEKDQTMQGTWMTIYRNRKVGDDGEFMHEEYGDDGDVERGTIELNLERIGTQEEQLAFHERRKKGGSRGRGDDIVGLLAGCARPGTDAYRVQVSPVDEASDAATDAGDGD